MSAPDAPSPPTRFILGSAAILLGWLATDALRLPAQTLYPGLGLPVQLLTLSAVSSACWLWWRAWLRLSPAVRPPTQLSRARARLLLPIAALLAVFTIVLAYDVPRAGSSLTASTWVVVSLVPLAEEWLFRGVLFALSRQILGTALAILAVSALFALLHLPLDTAPMLALFVLSLLNCLSVLYLHSVLPAIALHAAWNTVAEMLLLSSNRERVLLGATVCAALLALAVLPWLRSHWTAKRAPDELPETDAK